MFQQDTPSKSSFDYIEFSRLVVESAVDIDNYSHGRSRDLNSVARILNGIKRHQSLESESGINMAHFSDFYYPFWQAVLKTSPKKIRQPSELALEFKLFVSELEDVLSAPADPERLDEMSSFLCAFSKELNLTANVSMGYRRDFAA